MTKSLNDPSITLVNHASVVIKEGSVAILSDPWYFGTAFNDGWSLLYENPQSDIEKILESISHIWISHEHPDHFSVPFFISYADLINKKGIEILFQKTHDKRVVNFLKAKKLNVRELEDKKQYHLSNNFSIRCIKSFFYDSALSIEVGDKRILNLNDCPIVQPKEIESFRKEFGRYDILLTQFSYAAWKGGRKNISWRKTAAKEKLDAMHNQALILGAKSIIPFASFIRFSNHMNEYLNYEINRPNDVVSFLDTEDVNVLFLKPMQEIPVSKISDSKLGISFWEEQFDLVPNADLSRSDKIESETLLNESFQKYQKRIFNNNSKFLIHMASRLPFIDLFRRTRLKLIDFDKCVDVDIFEENLIFSDLVENYDIALDSQSLDFLFRNTFGFDTLTVNGCFEEGNKGGFAKFTKTLAIENLNNLGLSLNLKLIFRLDLVFLFLKSVRRVSNHLKEK
ncbi:MAG: hypothetical protein VYC46_04680 [Pseudomonadota bacterium]|nr:hypothetical protein [Pseudomonadota bacterium]MEC7910977.1 hypothetical protein [Pseudomonadota bacterium]